ncbi:MAG: hypothetical protein EKK54_11550 [Neisseriaceae bacterium]|nr:MAG: hypothetical protein EKK54_11550 [Neisseriaceae bacterium]
MKANILARRIFSSTLLVASLATLSCSNGNNSSASNNTSQNPLQSYVSQLQYTPFSKSTNKSLNSTIGNQQSIFIQNSATFNSIQIAYFKDTNCTSLVNTVTLNGPATLSAGTYTSTDQSNFALCSKYPDSGCVGLFESASTSSGGWSMQYTYYYSNGTSYQSVCMNNSANIAKNYEVEANYSTPSNPIACTSGSSCGFSQAYPLLSMGWAVESGALNGGVYGMGIAYNEATIGSISVVGYTNTALASDLTQSGTTDYFIAKYDANTHRQLWVRQVGDSGGDTSGQGITTDGSGNIYITGYTSVGISGQILQGNQDYFIAKYDADGNLQWTREVGAPNGTTGGNGISISGDDKIYITGDTDVGISGQTLQGAKDYFVAQYDVNGNLLWTREVGASGGTTIGSGVTVDSTVDRNVYVTGKTTQGISGQTQSGNTDYFIAKYSSDGNLITTIQYGPLQGLQGNSSAYAIVANQACRCIFVTGSTDTGIFGSQNGLSDYFIAKYDYSLNYAWGTQVGAAGGYSVGTGVSADGSGNAYLAGYTTKGISGQTQVGGENYFIAKYSSDNVLQWGYQAGGANGVADGYGIATDVSGNSYLTGYTSGSGVMGQSLIGTTDYFIVSYINQ